MTYAHSMTVTNASLRREDFAHFKAMQRGSEKLRKALVKALHTPIRPINPPRPRVHVPASVQAMPEAVRTIINGIAEDMDVYPEDIWGKSRAGEIMAARLVAYVALVRRGSSMAQVGRWVGGRDHTTVRHGLMTFDRDATPWMREIARRYGERAA